LSDLVSEVSSDFEKEILNFSRAIEHFGDPRLAFDIIKLLADDAEEHRKAAMG